jgi:predicted metal-dependent peptidase
LENKAKEALNMKNVMKRKLNESTIETDCVDNTNSNNEKYANNADKEMDNKIDKKIEEKTVSKMHKEVVAEVEKEVEKEVEEKECTRMHKKLTVGVIAMNKYGQVRENEKKKERRYLILLLLGCTAFTVYL